MVNSTGQNLSTKVLVPNLYHAWKAGRTTLPVNPALSVYAHFKHVVGVPAGNKQEQVPINKLRLLDLLIERLTRLRNKSDLPVVAPNQQEVTQDNLEATINYLQQELNRSLQVSKPLFSGQFNTDTGLLFNLYA